MRKKPTKIMLAVLSHVPERGALWTADIARKAGRSVTSTYATLRRLDEHKLVKVAESGDAHRPRSWRRAQASRPAKENEGHG